MKITRTVKCHHCDKKLKIELQISIDDSWVEVEYAGERQLRNRRDCCLPL